MVPLPLPSMGARLLVRYASFAVFTVVQSLFRMPPVSLQAR